MAHRGKHPDDNYYFVEQAAIASRMGEAAADMAYLLERGYGDNAALQLVGNRYQLHRRQQMALRRMVATAEAVRAREKTKWQPDIAQPIRLAIDGYNLLIFLEAALSGAFLFEGADGCLRDLSGVHGSYHSVEETDAALQIAANGLATLPITEVCWLFDAPVSNSGRLCTKFRAFAEMAEYPLAFAWEVRLVNNPDNELIAMAKENWVIATTDAFILDSVPQWAALGLYLQKIYIPEAQILSFIQ
jgi:hypothetical protein